MPAGTSRPAGPGAGPIERLLSADHERLDQLLRQAIAGGGAIDAAPYAEFRRGLLRHIGIEEKLLLPAAQRAHGGEALAAATRLRLDHGAIAALLVPTPTPEIVTTLRALLSDHDAVEEGSDGVYAACDRLLADEAGPLVDEMRAYPTPPASPHNDGPEVMPAVRRALARAGGRLAGDAGG
jgi:hypothetical protein